MASVLIVTLCRSLNFGAYLQAYALQQVLRNKGLDPVFVDVYDAPQLIKRHFVLLKPKDMTPSGILFNIKKLITFNAAEKKLTIKKLVDIGPVKGAFLGSDEIWNVTNTSFVHSPEFFGNSLPSVKTFSYAPSSGNCQTDDLKRYQNLVDGIRRLDMVSVRDSGTADLVRQVAPRSEIFQVLDPAFLYDFSAEEEDVLVKKPFAVVYSYNMSNARIQEIRRYATRNNILLVSPGFYNVWCDEVIPCSPFQFLSLVRRSECVITDTFHGTVFSIKYRKNFASFSEGKNKIKSLLSELGLESSSVGEGDLDNTGVIETSYDGIDEILESKLKKSNDYIDNCINMMRDG